MRSLLLVALAAVVLVPAQRAPAAAAQSDGQAPPGPGPFAYERVEFTLDSATGPDRSITHTLDAEAWIPQGVSAARTVPAVINLHGFSGDKANNESLAWSAYFASHGYLVVSYTAQGFGASEGCIALDRLDYDGTNIINVVDWLAARDDVATNAAGDPRVGLVGGSYGGGAQGLAAVADPRIDAIVPNRTWDSLVYSLVPNNHIPDPSDPWAAFAEYDQGLFKLGWTSLFFAAGQREPLEGRGGCDLLTQQTLYPGAPPCQGFLPQVCETYTRLAATGSAEEEDRDLVRGSARGAAIGDLRTPTLLTQGYPDTLFNPNEPIRTLVELQERDVPVAVIWHSSGHGGYGGAPGEGEAATAAWNDTPESQAEFAQAYLPRRTLNWFERHVRGDGEADTGPAFAWFQPWVEYDIAATGGTAAPAYGMADTFPPPQTTVADLVLDLGSGALAVDGVAAGTATLLHPANGQPAAYSELPNFSSPGQPGDRPPTEIPGQNATLTTAPFERPVDVVGVPTLTLQVTHQNGVQDVPLFVKLYDVAPDGSTTLVYRQVAASRLPADTDGETTLRLTGLAYRFDAGHALRLVVATTDAAYKTPPLPDSITLASSPDAPSALHLPVLTEPDRPELVPTVDPEPDPAAQAIPDLPTTGAGLALLAFLLAAVGSAGRRQRGGPEASLLS